MVNLSAENTDTERLAYWIRNFDESSVPKEIYDAVKLLVLDTLGVMLLATKLDPGKIIINFGRKSISSESSYIFGVQPRLNPPLAGLIGGTLGHGDELDEVYLLGDAHIAASVVPTCICMADVNGTSVKEFLHAVLTGYEVAANLTTAMGRGTLKKRNFHPTSVLGTFGCTASACKLLRLEKAAIAHALGLTASQASGTIAWHTEQEHMTKSFQLGVATRNAITSALLAAEGFTSVKSVFDGPYNIFQIFAGIIPPSDWVQKIGIEFQVVHASLKKYSAGRPIHAVLDALSLIEKEHTFGLRDIERVEVSMPPETAKIVDKNPTISIDCQYIVAKALTEGVKSLIYDMQSEAKKGSYQDLMNKISIVYDHSLSQYYPEHWPAIIRIYLRENRILEKQVVHVSGSKSNPMRKEEILSKFHSLSQPLLGEKRVQDIIGLFDSENGDMHELTEILTLN